MRNRILSIILLVLVAVGVCIGAAAYLKSTNPDEPKQQTQDETADNHVFLLDDLEDDPIEKIWLQSGSTGNSLSFDSTEDIEWFASRLKALTYDYTLDPLRDPGWSCRIIIDRKYRDTESIVDTLSVEKYNEKGQRTVYVLTPESQEIMKEIIAFKPE